jgi:regulator of cell morphogenesis and NO signaling
MTTHTGLTVGELAARSPGAARVFEDYGIDFCCGGARPFEEACRERNLNPAAVMRRIESESADESAHPVNWELAPLNDLIGHILARHHTYLREELPRLAARMAAVRRAHAERDGAMLEALGDVFTHLKDELEMHMRKEEVILFPSILRSEGWIGQPISVMEQEHASAGKALAEMRRLTGGYRPPEHACAAYRALYAGLDALEKDLHMHIHLENNILFPRAIAEMNRARGC